MCTKKELIRMITGLVTCCCISWMTLKTDSVVLKSLSTRSASECCTVCDQTETCQCVSYKEQTNVCEIRGSLEEIPDWVLISGRDTTYEAVKVHHFVKEQALLTSPLCGYYLVSGDHGVPDEQLLASSVYDQQDRIHGAHRGRLFSVDERLPNGTRQVGAWIAGSLDKNQYIQVEFNNISIVRGIATQGRNVYGQASIYVYQRVKAYRALYSLDCATFRTVTDIDGSEIFPGNTDQDSVVTNTLDSPVLARCFRINPVSWKAHISMRFDVLGCNL